MTASIEQTVRTEFSTAFPIIRPSVPIGYDNMPFDPETEARNQSGDPIPWVFLTILPADRDPVDLGSTTQRNLGLVWIQCYAAIGVGSGEVAEIARDAGAIFEAKTISGVTFRSARPERVGPEGSWYRRDVKIEYVSDEIP